MNTVFFVIGIVFLIIAIVSYFIGAVKGTVIEIGPYTAFNLLLAVVGVIVIAYAWNH